MIFSIVVLAMNKPECIYMNDKSLFIEKMKSRTQQLAVDVIHLCDTLKTCKASGVITYQIVKSATSTGANYRAACRGRSEKEFFSKMSIVIEECDETEYWLEVINLAQLSSDQKKLDYLLQEYNEITRIVTKARTTLYDKRNQK